jgi:hypothetical protein
MRWHSNEALPLETYALIPIRELPKKARDKAIGKLKMKDGELVRLLAELGVKAKDVPKLLGEQKAMAIGLCDLADSVAGTARLRTELGVVAFGSVLSKTMRSCVEIGFFPRVASS